MKSVVSFEEMVSLYLVNDLSDDVWDMFYEMAVYSLISPDNWSKFSDECCKWVIDEDADTEIVRDSTNYKIVIAKRNSDGLWELVK